MKMTLRIFFVLIISVLLSACAPSSAGSQPDEQVSEFDLTLAAIPNLEPILFQENDFPYGYSAGSTASKVPTYYSKIFIPVPDQFIRQQIQRDSKPAGQVDVLYYINGETTRFAFIDIKDDMKDASELTDIGEMAVIEITSKDQIALRDSIAIVFTQCHVVVHISILGIRDTEIVTSYSKKLSERLKSLLCD